MDGGESQSGSQLPPGREVRYPDFPLLLLCNDPTASR